MEVYNPDNLLAGGTQVVTDTATIASGENVARGAVLGKVTADGTYKLSLSGASDGSQTPVAILAEDVDASAAAKSGGAIYIKGEFNVNALTLGTGHTAASIKDGLRDGGIYIKTVVGA